VPSAPALRLLLDAGGWLAGAWLLWTVPPCGPARGRAQAGDVSVLVPARDEEARLPTLLASLAAQRPPPAEVVVADDHSSDATAAVALRHGALAVPCDPLPAGWTGKSWACWTAAETATRPVLVFLDADTELAAGGLERILEIGRASCRERV
jgi:4,4'-diaponeurosporenoate glycosyltransferase